MTNLISVNAQTISDLTLHFNQLWSAPIQISICIFMLWQYLGVATLVGVFVMLVFIPFNLILATFSKRIQTKKLKVMDKRIKLTNEILGGIKVIKFYGWEKSFQDIIENIRQKELGLLKSMFILDAGQRFTFWCSPVIVSVASFAAFVLIDENNVLDASTAFVSMSLFNLMRIPMTLLPDIISAVINVNKFLLSF